MYPPKSQYLPMVDPTDATSIPDPPPPAQPILVPLRPRRGGRLAGSRTIHQMADDGPLIGHFCYSDHTLRRLERTDALGLRLARAARVPQCVTMDVPFYAFMTSAQRERAWTQHFHRLTSSLERFPRHGIEPLPLLKGFGAGDWSGQLALLGELGVRRCAFYARELLLEGRAEALRKFVRMTNRAGIQPLLMGVFTPHAATWGPATFAAQHHHVLARRGEILLPQGGRVPLSTPEYSPFVRRWISRRDVAGLSTHNYWRARTLLATGPTLGEFFTGG